MSRIDDIEALLAARGSELEDRGRLLQAQQDELASHRRELAELQHELALLRPSSHASASDDPSEVAPRSDDAFGRRRLLGRLAAVAAAGVGLAASETIVHPGTAAADASTSAVYGDGSTNKDGVEGKANAANRSGVYGHNVGTGAGVYATSAGVGVHADTTSTSKPAIEAAAPVTGRGLVAITGTGAPAEAVDAESGVNLAGTAVFGSSGGDGAGVVGVSRNRVGVYGGSTDGVGVVAYGVNQPGLVALSVAQIGILAIGGLVPLHLAPRPGTGAPPLGSFQVGQVVVDQAGDIFVCTTAGTDAGAVWSKVQYGSGGEGGGGLQVLTTPGRLMDSRGGAPITHSSQKVAKGEIYTIQVTGKVGVPAGATAVTGSIAVTQPEGAGYLRLFPAQLASSTTSVINFAPGQTIANAFTAALSPTGQLKVQAVDAKTHVIIDITGHVA